MLERNTRTLVIRYCLKIRVASTVRPHHRTACWSFPVLPGQWCTQLCELRTGSYAPERAFVPLLRLPIGSHPCSTMRPFAFFCTNLTPRAVLQIRCRCCRRATWSLTA